MGTGILSQWTNTAKSVVSQATKQQTGIDASQSSTDPHVLTSNKKYLVQIVQDQDIQTISSSKSPIIVNGQVPDEFHIDQQAQWKAPWGAGLAGDGNVADLLAVTMGTRLLAQVQTLQVWQGATNDIEFTVTLELRAWSDVDLDVMIPLQALMSMIVPSVDPSSGWLRSPGPILDSAGVQAIGQGIASFVINAADNAQKTALDTIANGGSVLGAAYAGGKSIANDTGKSLYAAKAKLESLLKNKIEVRIGDWFRMRNVVITNVQPVLKTQMPGPNGGIMAANVSITFKPLFALTTEDIPSILMLAAQRGATPLTIGQKYANSPFALAQNSVNGVSRL